MQIITISSKNQITIPTKTLESLGFGKKAIIESESGVIKIIPVGDSVINEVAGSLRKYISKNKLGVDIKTIDIKTKEITSKKLAIK